LTKSVKGIPFIYFFITKHKVTSNYLEFIESKTIVTYDYMISFVEISQSLTPFIPKDRANPSPNAAWRFSR
jgi:hypothetical protein